MFERIKDILEKNSYFYHYFNDKHFRVRLTLIIGILTNLFYLVFNGIIGILYSDFLSCLTIVVYYTLTLFVRCIILRVQGSSYTERDGYLASLICGVLILLLFVPVSVIIIYTLVTKEVNSYSESVIAILASYAIYTLVSVVLYIRRSEGDSLLTHRVAYSTRLVTALMSAFNLFVALLPGFSVGKIVALVLIFVFGTSVALIVLFLGLSIVKRSVNALKKQNNSSNIL